jgi:hypothetical protein
VPPRFDFAGSENVKSLTVRWPAPKRFVDSAGGHSIGYIGDVTFPLRITPLDTTKPSSLHLKLGYAVCGKFCMPADTNLEITLSGKSSGEEPALVAAEARVPRRVALDTGIVCCRPWRPSTDTVKVVPSDAALSGTIGSRCSRRASSGVSGAQTMPDVWRMTNAIFSGVHRLAATEAGFCKPLPLYHEGARIAGRHRCAFTRGVIFRFSEHR